jgi:hypothetical protein
MGFIVSQSIVFNATGFFGGYFPFLHDLISRQKLPKEEKIDLNCEFFFIKAVLIPLGALFITSLAVAFGNVTTWLAALYLGASLPVLIEKALSSSNATVANLGQQQ